MTFVKSSVIVGVFLFLIGTTALSQTNLFPPTGVVGIGTTTPTKILDIRAEDDASAAILLYKGVNRIAYLGTGSSAAGNEHGYLGLNNNAGGVGIQLNTHGTSFITGGYFGIGTPSPIAPLTLYTGFENSDLAAAGFNIQSTGTATTGDIIPLTFTGLGNTNRARAGIGMVVGSDWGKGDLIFLTKNASNGAALTSSDERMRIDKDGYVGIGTNAPDQRLSVAGNISANGNVYTKKVIVTQLGWSDYVFHEDYKLRSLSELAAFIKKNKHLPEIPNEKEVEKNGIDVGDTQALLLKKIEELTLYVIELKKESVHQQKQISKLSKLVRSR